MIIAQVNLDFSNRGVGCFRESPGIKSYRSLLCQSIDFIALERNEICLSNDKEGRGLVERGA